MFESVFAELAGACKTHAINASGKTVRKSSLLLASGWWGVARHFQYAFELTAVRPHA